MDLKLVAFAVFAIAVMVIGVLEWLKAGIPKLPGWMPWVLSPVLCFALAAVTAPLIGMKGWWFAVFGFLSLAVAEICYQTIVQGLRGLVQQATAAAQSRLVDAQLKQIVVDGKTQ